MGRRGTGKTTLLYRAFVACMESWRKEHPKHIAPKARTLGIYVDLSKCQYIEDVADHEFIAFEHAFVSEVCDVISEQLTRFWPDLTEKPEYSSRLFKAAESNQDVAFRTLCAENAGLGFDLPAENQIQKPDRTQLHLPVQTVDATLLQSFDSIMLFQSTSLLAGCRFNLNRAAFSLIRVSPAD